MAAFAGQASEHFWARIPGDVTNNGIVDVVDLHLIMANMGRIGDDLTAFDGDVNGDGRVDEADLLITIDHVGWDQFMYADALNADGVAASGGCCYECPDPSGYEVICCDQGMGAPTGCSGSCRPLPDCGGGGGGGGDGGVGGDPAACQIDPCHLDCPTAACDIECGGDPCSEYCPYRECNPECGGDEHGDFGPCHPDCPTRWCDENCVDLGGGGGSGGPCHQNCPTAGCDPSCAQFDPCNADCGTDANGNPYGPCHPDCADDSQECPCKFDIEGDGGSPVDRFVCADAPLTLCAEDEPCPIECDDVDCDNEDQTVAWSADPPGAVEWPQGNEGLCVSVKIVQPGDVTFTATRGCCEARPITTTAVRIRLESVEFGGTTFHPVARDTTGQPYAPAGTPHWQAGTEPFCDPYCSIGFWDSFCDAAADQLGIQHHPIAYTRDTPVYIERVEFTVEPSGLNLVDANVSPTSAVGGAIDVPLQIVGSNALVAEDFAFATALPDAIGYIYPLVIHWNPDLAIKDSGQSYLLGDCWPCGAAESFNTLYVTLEDPQVSPLYHTVVHRACEHAHGKDTEQDAIDGIWDYITGMVVQNVEDEPQEGFGYWRSPAGGCAQVQCLITGFDGQCGAWGRFLRDVLKVHGIAAGNREILPDPNAPGVPAGTPAPHGLLVKNWTKSPPFTDLPGIQGQGGVADPHSAFFDHAVVELNGLLYDPSYGTGPFVTLLDWQRASLDVVVFGIESQSPWWTANTSDTWPLFTTLGSLQP